MSDEIRMTLLHHSTNDLIEELLMWRGRAAEHLDRIAELKGVVDKLIEVGDELADDREYQDDLVDLWHDVTRGLKEREE